MPILREAFLASNCPVAGLAVSLPDHRDPQGRLSLEQLTELLSNGHVVQVDGLLSQGLDDADDLVGPGQLVDQSTDEVIKYRPIVELAAGLDDAGLNPGLQIGDPGVLPGAVDSYPQGIHICGRFFLDQFGPVNALFHGGQDSKLIGIDIDIL